MAASFNPDAELKEEISKTAGFVDKTKSELEKMFGLLYIHGKPRDMAETERQKLVGLCKMLEDMKDSIDNFQKDSAEVCGMDYLKPTEKRETQGRTRQRESGYKSADMSKVFNTPAQSSDRLSRTETDDTAVTSAEAAELYDPSIPFLRSTTSNEGLTRNEVPSFYIETPQTSTTSLAVVDEPENSDCVINPNAEQEHDLLTVAKELNDLSKPPSEEDNTKQAIVSVSSA